jgi:cyanophycinase
MIMGGVSYNALLNGAFPDGEKVGPDDLIYDPLGGIEMMDSYQLYSHFGERGRQGRLIRLLSDTRDQSRGVQYGFGVDEDTALVVYDVNTTQATGEVVGRGGVLLVDISSSSLDTTAEYFTIRRVTGHYLTHGDHIDLTTREVQFDTTWKFDLAGNESNLFAMTSDNIFGGVIEAGGKPEFVRVSTSLFDAQLDTVTSGTTIEKSPKFLVTFSKDTAISRGFGGNSPVTGRWEISYSDLLIDIEQAIERNI